MLTAVDDPRVSEKFIALVALVVLIAGVFTCLGIGFVGALEGEGFFWPLVAGSIIYAPMLLLFAGIALIVAIIPMMAIWRFLLGRLTQRGWLLQGSAMASAPVIAVFGTAVFYVLVGVMQGEWTTFAWDKLNMIGLYGAVPAITLSPIVAARLFQESADD